VDIRLLRRDEISRIWEIDRREFIANIYRLTNGELILERHNFDVPGWAPGKPDAETPLYLDCLDRGGSAWGACEGDSVIGVAILESRLIGAARDTLQLKFLHVGNGHRGRGIGARLFGLAADRARSLGARKLYVSATPSENTVTFYQRRGCVLATEVDPELFSLEPEDIHLVCVL
jgi:predicted N-acetyltransferase YhbS